MDQETSGRDNLHKTCRQQYDHLHEEFERYKLRAQSVLKNKNSRVSGCSLVSFAPYSSSMWGVITQDVNKWVFV